MAEQKTGKSRKRGCLKVVLAIINGGLGAVLVARTLTQYRWPHELVILGAAIALVVIGLLHQLYIKFAYGRRYLIS